MYFSLVPDIKQPVRPISFPFSESEYITAKNFFRRYQVNPDIFEYAVYFKKYAIEEGDRLDNVADKLYGDPELDWVIVLSNGMINPQFSMPLRDQTVVKIDVNGKFYPISCKIGEEDRVIASGELLSEIISTLDNQDNKVSESKILLMAALILADKNLRNTNETSDTVSKETLDSIEIISWLEQINLKFKNIERLINNS